MKPEQVDEVILGNCIMRNDEANIARMAAINAGIPIDKPAFTVQRQCSSGMQAIVCGFKKLFWGCRNCCGRRYVMSSAPIF